MAMTIPAASNNDNDNVAPCCPGCYVKIKTPPIQKDS